jgi:signal transduction histidine kinase
LKPVEAIIEPQRTVRKIERGRLFRKYLLLILALVCGALLISGSIGIYFSYQENKVALSSVQREKAVAAAARIEQFIRQIEQQLAFAALPQLGSEGIEQRRIEFLKLQRLVPAITDTTQIDSKGNEQLSVSRLQMDVVSSSSDRSKDPAFLGAKPKQTWFGPVNFRKETEPYMSIAVRSSEGGPVTVADVNLKFIWDVITRIKIGKKGKAYVVDATGHLVADPDIGLVLRKTDMSQLPQVKVALGKTVDDSRALVARDVAGEEVLTAFGTIEPMGWRVFVEQPVSEVYATLDAAILRTVILMVAGLLFSVFAAVWLARSMVRPIRTLQEGAARIGEGNLDQNIDIKTGDELQALAEQFNRMSARLRESYAGLERKVEERTAALQKTLDQQTATSEILRVISGSPTDVQPVFDAIVRNAVTLCGGMYANVFRFDGELLHFGASNSSRPEFIEDLRARYPMRPIHSQVSGRVILNASMARIEDALTDPTYDREMAIEGGYRRLLGVPMLREGRPLGAMVVGWADAGPISRAQEELLQTFADQAAIAIENVRLFNETKESLEQQTATSEILRVISSSTTDVQPVFEAIAKSGLHLFDDANVWVVLRDSDTIRAAAISERDPERTAKWKAAFPTPLTHDFLNASAILDSAIVDIPDVDSLPKPLKPGTANFAATGYKAVTITPMMRGEEAIGAIGVARLRPGPLSDKQVALLKTFADQAVIAIENVRLFHEIQEKSRQLEIANQHKSDFLANMSHELRTPLNAIIGFSEVLVEKMFGEVNDKQLDYLQDIHSSGKHLLSLINDILDLSKIEAGRMELDVAEFDLRSALENAITLVKERAQRHGIALSLEVDPSLGMFRGDERKFKQILLNLLSNAVKFTPEGGKVAVAARPAANVVEFSVADTGVGIAAEDQQLVFEEFRQVGKDYTRKAEGTGLGLALTKRFVELHGGTIRLESAPGKGATFTFTIPLGL